MTRAAVAALSLFTVVPLLLSAQQTPTRTKGVIFKAEVDQLVQALNEQAIADQAPLGGGSPLATAKIVTALGHCHRRYSIQDSRLLRASMRQMHEQRGEDGSYCAADAAARKELTGWVVDALTSVDREGAQAEIADATAWLGKAGVEQTPWQAAVRAVMADVRADQFPQHIGAPAQNKVRELFAVRPARIDAVAAADLLVGLVACQAANRALDKAQDSGAQAVFSPAQQKGVDWLMKQQKDGVFVFEMGGKKVPDAGFTGFGQQALQTKPKAQRSKEEQAAIDAGMKWLLEQQNADGSFGQHTVNYVTSVVVGALARYDTPEAKAASAKAQKFLLSIQNIEQRSFEKGDRDYGSMGYSGGQARGDLSNLNFSLQALRESGLPADHEAFAKAVVFLQRTQNLKSVNDFTAKTTTEDGKTVITEPGNDGGAIYYPGNSEFGFIELPDGKRVPRSYGSMTYALLKAYVLCGLKADDARVQAVVNWVCSNWTVTENPGADPKLGEKGKFAGLFYYYMVLAQALDLVGLEEVTAKVDGKEAKVPWRKTLRAQLESMQAADGSWSNAKNDRWYESLPMIATSYSMLALEKCR